VPSAECTAKLLKTSRLNRREESTHTHTHTHINHHAGLKISFVFLPHPLGHENPDGGAPTQFNHPFLVYRCDNPDRCAAKYSSTNIIGVEFVWHRAIHYVYLRQRCCAACKLVHSLCTVDCWITWFSWPILSASGVYHLQRMHSVSQEVLWLADTDVCRIRNWTTIRESGWFSTKKTRNFKRHEHTHIQPAAAAPILDFLCRGGAITPMGCEKNNSYRTLVFHVAPCAGAKTTVD